MCGVLIGVQVLELEPGHRSAYVMRGEAHRQLGNEQEAIEDYTRALFIDPTDVEAYLVRGEANLADHNYLDALHDFQKALDLQVRKSPFSNTAAATFGSPPYRITRPEREKGSGDSWGGPPR